MRMNNLWRMLHVKRTNGDGSLTLVQSFATIRNVLWLIEYRKDQGWVVFRRGVRMGCEIITYGRSCRRGSAVGPASVANGQTISVFRLSPWITP